jgi:hypothetical protein
MEKRVLALSLLAIVVVTSGCIDPGSNGTESEGNAAITVHDFSVSPDQIYQGSTVRVSLQFANTGNVNATLWSGDQGEKVFKNYCPDVFTLNGGRSSFQSTPGEIETQQSYNFRPGEEAELQWVLEQDSNVPLIGYDCGLDVEIPFNYTVSAFRQVQIKNSRQIEGTKSLESKSSDGPLKFAIEAIGGTGEEGESTYVVGEDEASDESAQILFQLQNKEEENHAKGLIDVDETSLEINGESPIDISYPEDCDFDPSKDRIRKFKGQTNLISCKVELPDSINSPSQISEIEASVDYTYLKQAGEHNVNVEYREN